MTKNFQFFVTGCICYSAAFGMSACKFRSSSQQKNEANVKESISTTAVDSIRPLDVNDVSILFPAFTQQMKFNFGLKTDPGLIDLSLKREDGKELFSQAQFDELLAARCDSLPDFKNINSGIFLKAIPGEPKTKGRSTVISDNRMANPERTIEFMDASKRENWKVIAMRFDPCAPTQISNHFVDRNLGAISNFDEKKCQVQLRVTLQPQETILVRARGFEKGATEYLMGDYGIHLFFSMPKAQGVSLAKDLVAIGDACGSLTDGAPLSVHPCLLDEAKKGKKDAHLKYEKF